MSHKGVMGIPSKPAYRSHRNAPTRRQILRAERLNKIEGVSNHA